MLLLRQFYNSKFLNSQLFSRGSIIEMNFFMFEILSTKFTQEHWVKMIIFNFQTNHLLYLLTFVLILII